MLKGKFKTKDELISHGFQNQSLEESSYTLFLHRIIENEIEDYHDVVDCIFLNCIVFWGAHTHDVVSIISGFLYHDIAGGNDLMQVKGNWSNKYSKEEIDWKANGDERIKKMMENLRKEQDSLRQEYNKMDEYNRTIFPLGN